jgi:hypothetical protein
VRFEDLAALSVRIAVFWDVTSWSLVDRRQRFAETCCYIFRTLKTEKPVSSEIFASHSQKAVILTQVKITT